MTSTYHVFICHAVEDKIAVANELYAMLKKAGIYTWYSSNELNIGDSIEDKIRRGLAASHCGIIIISPSFFPKRWPTKELSTLVSDKKKIFPIWHDITLEEVKKYDPKLADLYGLSSDQGLEVIVDQLVPKIKENIILNGHEYEVKRKWSKNILRLLLSILVLIAIVTGLLIWKEGLEFDKVVNKAVNNRIMNLEQFITNKLTADNFSGNCETVSKENVCSVISQFGGSRFRFNFEDGINKRIEHKVNVQNSLIVPIDKKAICQSFDLEQSDCELFMDCSKQDSLYKLFRFRLNDPVTYRIDSKMNVNDTRRGVVVSYEHFIRQVEIKQEYYPGIAGTGMTTTSIIGILPVEIFHFIKEGSDWKLIAISKQLGK